MDENKELAQVPIEEVEAQAVTLAKHCPNEECMLYNRPQPNRTWCVECDSVLVD